MDYADDSQESDWSNHLFSTIDDLAYTERKFGLRNGPRWAVESQGGVNLPGDSIEGRTSH